MGLFKKKKTIGKQAPWRVVWYKPALAGAEFDTGFVEFVHSQTGQVFRKEVDWLTGEGAYEVAGYDPPTLLDIWTMMAKLTPGAQGFTYKNWHVKRDIGCFIYVLAGSRHGNPVERYKNIIGDATCKAHDFAAFIEMLDRIESHEQESTSKPIINLSDMREKREKLA